MLPIIMKDFMPLPALVFLLLALLLSAAFRLTTATTAPLWARQTAKQRMMTFHAFAIEGLQVLIVASGVYQVYSTATPQATLESIITASVRLLASVIAHGIAVFGVDFIESLVILGTIRHPVQIQTFLLTREVLWPMLARSCVASSMEICGIPVPKGGSMVIVASKFFGVQHARNIVIMQKKMKIRRRLSSGDVRTVEEMSRALTTPATPMRRFSFPDDQLNTSPILRDSRTSHLTSMHKKADKDTPSLQFRGRATTVPRKISFGSRGSSGSSSRVKTIVGNIEGGSSQSRERAAKGHVAARWRPAGGRLQY